MENDTPVERRIRERAFEIWIEEGQPYGREKEHWARAEKEVSNAPSSVPGKASASLLDGGEGSSPEEG